MIYKYIGGKKLICGYTTGSCAAAAAGAAAQFLLSGKKPDAVKLEVPSGDTLLLNITDAGIFESSAQCAVIKDGGDDPDVTSGLKIFADVSRIESGIRIIGGEGVGIVTKPGLDRPVGDHAINTVPRKMIKKAVWDAAEKYGYSGGFLVKIFVPGGEETAKKTFNPKMGIEGGISIIGTTGIVEPMSERAVVETIRVGANMRKSSGDRVLVLSVGNYSESFLHENYPSLSEKCVMCSNFIGEAFDIGAAMGFDGIILIGHIGKLVKLGSGIMNTHSSYADGRIETLITCGALAGVGSTVLSRINDCATTDAAIDILCEDGTAEKVLEILTQRIHSYLQARAKGKAKIGAVIFSYKNDIQLRTEYADEIIAQLEV